MERVVVDLPSGVERSGRWVRTVRLRPIAGADEVALAGEPLAARRTSTLLARCVMRLGAERCTLADVRELSVGDREALLLHLYRMAFGDRVELVLRCPDETCGERMEIPISIAEMLAPPSSDARSVHDVTLADHRLKVRRPTGRAQERAAELALTDEAAALAHLVASCVVEIHSPTGEPLETVPAALVDPLATFLEELEPQAQTTLAVDCIGCGRAFTNVIDAAHLLFGAIGPERIFQDVHALASHYHWSEAAILRLSSQRRRQYLALIDESEHA